MYIDSILGSETTVGIVHCLVMIMNYDRYDHHDHDHDVEKKWLPKTTGISKKDKYYNNKSEKNVCMIIYVVV